MRSLEKGTTMLEFTLVGIAMIFVLISLFEIVRGMWAYHTLAYAVREATRYSAMHGVDCNTPNTCTKEISDIITYMQHAGGGFDPGNTTLTLSAGGTQVASDTITNLASSTTAFPPVSSYSVGSVVQISAKYKFRTILSVFWVGAGAPLNDSQNFYLQANSTELIQF